MLFVETDSHPIVLEREFKRLLKVPPRFEFTDQMAECAAWVRTWCATHSRPWLCARVVEPCEIREGHVHLEGVGLTSRELARRFRHAQTAVIVGASAGIEAEAEAARRWAEDEPDRYYFLETYASAIVEALIAEAQARLCAWADASGRTLLPHYSPGYQGWTVGDQARVHGLLARGRDLPGPLEVMESGMLRPKKSQLAVFAVAPSELVPPAEADLVPCRHCSLARCDFRREPNLSLA
ncbi:MAG: hypothetical protein ACHQ4G_03715 [Opitutales bacterium]